MSFEINEMKGNLARVSWVAKFNSRDGEIDHTFQLGHFRCTPQFKLPFKHRVADDCSTVDNNSCQVDIILSLMKILSTSEGTDKATTTDGNSNCDHRPCSVRFNINESEIGPTLDETIRFLCKVEIGRNPCEFLRTSQL